MIIIIIIITIIIIIITIIIIIIIKIIITITTTTTIEEKLALSQRELGFFRSVPFPLEFPTDLLLYQLQRFCRQTTCELHNKKERK